jgi:hypothetical protein
MRFGTWSSWDVGAILVAVTLAFGAGCDSGNGNGNPDAVQADVRADVPADVSAAPLAIAGSYTDAFGGQHEIASDTWVQTGDFGSGPVTSTFLLTRYDNDARWVVGQNDAANAFNPGKWSRFDWATVQAALYFCQTRYDAADEAEALAATPADATDPKTAGCGGFAWTALTPVAR